MRVELSVRSQELSWGYTDSTDDKVKQTIIWLLEEFDIDKVFLSLDTKILHLRRKEEKTYRTRLQMLHHR